MDWPSPQGWMSTTAVQERVLGKGMADEIIHPWRNGQSISFPELPKLPALRSMSAMAMLRQLTVVSEWPNRGPNLSARKRFAS
jgi:hypothetical protein